MTRAGILPAATLLAALCAAGPAAAQPPLLPGLGSYSRPIRASAEARRYFDQGLALVYGFNHDEAIRAFEAAARLDSTSAMVHFGLALAYAPTVDRGRNAVRDRNARQALARAARYLDRARPADAELIRAWSVRYADSVPGPRLDSLYADSMGALWRRRPDDPDVAALYGESLMLLARRHYWNPDGSPAPGTAAMLAALERGMRAAPRHLGVNHYYIHALEMSPHPERALGAADRLQSAAPGLGHLVHMGAHVYYRLGRWADAVRANERARDADTALFRLSPPAPGGTYPAGYHLHTLHFLWMSLARSGRAAEALQVAETLAVRATASANAGVYAQPWAVAPLMVMARFEEWDAILATPAPPTGQRFSTAIWYYARGLADVTRGDLTTAGSAADTVEAIAAVFPGNLVAPTMPGKALLESAGRALRARILLARGRRDEAIALLQQNVAAEDAAGMMEPPPWYETAREALERAERLKG